MKFKHITGWTTYSLGQIYNSPPIESDYWKGKLINDKQASAEIEGMFNIIQQLIAHSKIDISFIPVELQKAKYYSELLKEFIFEDIRASEFPNLPSRKKCMFLIPFEVNAMAYAENMKYPLDNKTLLELELQDPYSLHYADLTLLNCNSMPHPQKVEAARRYWQGTEERGLNTEVLFEGRFKIAKVIEK
ncbi:MAG: hypothetical protein JWO09_869 [Bacteroidetes bacterium]|nr:hypothetical protein [Bacteroidota bacterium]